MATTDPTSPTNTATPAAAPVPIPAAVVGKAAPAPAVIRPAPGVTPATVATVSPTAVTGRGTGIDTAAIDRIRSMAGPTLTHCPHCGKQL